MIAGSGHARGGFTVVEVLAASAILAIGFVACATAFQHALSGVDGSRRQTAATFLAERKVEALKAVALDDWASPLLAATTVTEYCLPTIETCSTTRVTGAYRVVTAVADTPGGTCVAQCKIVSVAVFYRPITTVGSLDQERQMELVTLFASRT